MRTFEDKALVKEGREMVQRVYDMYRDRVSVSPTWLATECMMQLDPERRSHALEYKMAHLQFRQIARGICAGHWEAPDEEAGEEHDLFPDLQKRYPIHRPKDSEPEYVLLEHLSGIDIAFNVGRLRSEAVAKLKHADALEAYGKAREAA